MIRICLRSYLSKVTMILLVLGSSGGFPQWPIKGEKSFLPGSLDAPDEELKLYYDIYTLLKNALLEYRRTLEINDQPKGAVDTYDVIGRLGTDGFNQRSQPPYSEPTGAESKFWDDTVNKQYQKISYDDVDLIVNKKRDDIAQLCAEGNVFGSWLIKLCNERKNG